MPQNFSTSDFDIIENLKVENNAEEHFDNANQKDSSRLKENPFWLEGIMQNRELLNDRDKQNYSKLTRRAKRSLKKHTKKLNKNHHTHHKLHKRNTENMTNIYEEKYIDIIPNYLNENDTKHGVVTGRFYLYIFRV